MNSLEIECKDFRRIDGTIRWYKNGRLHREDGPAIEYHDGGCGSEWFLNGKRHREDGPAIIWPSGQYWYLDDFPFYNAVLFCEHLKIIGTKLTDEELTILMLKW